MRVGGVVNAGVASFHRGRSTVGEVVASSNGWLEGD
jgi:hypothetical protein